MRNLSCTTLFSKVLEHFVLQRIKGEVHVASNQFGGIKNSSTNHYLIEAWTEILENMNQEGSAACLISVDFAKAFNSMGHKACIKAFARAGASVHSLRFIAAFFLKRETIYKIGHNFSTPPTSHSWKPPRYAS